MSQNDFWESLARGHAATTYQSSLDLHLTGKAPEETFSSVRNLTDSGRRTGALQLPVPSGTMVVFAGGLGAMLALSNPPAKGMPGEVVSVKSAGGDVTSHDDVVFVKWADGQFRPVHAEYLRLAKIPKMSSTKDADLEDACWEGYEAFGMKDKDGKQVPNCVPVKKAPKKSANRIRVSSLGDLTQFLKTADGKLVHKSTKDLWSFKKDADGGLVVERMFDGSGKPLKLEG